MEYGRLVREAWSVTSRTRALWGLGAIVALQLVVYAAIVMSLSAPLAILPQMAESMSAEGGAASQGAVDGEQILVFAAQWVAARASLIAAVVLGVFLLWVVLGVLDVAAQVGMITQVEAVQERRTTSAGAGMADGFRYWWRAVALLAIAALPALVYLLISALVVLFTVSLPLYLGNQPAPGAALISNLVLTPLSAVSSLIAIPLAVLVQLALRFAVLDHASWRAAFGRAWRLAKGSFAEVALVYLLLVAVGFVVSLALMGVLALAGIVLATITLWISASMTGAPGGSAVATALVGLVVLGGLLFVAMQAVMFIWRSSVWTLFWREKTGRGGHAVTPTIGTVSGDAAGSTNEGGL